MKRHVLDFTLAPLPASTPTFLNPASEWGAVLDRHLPETVARLNGALHHTVRMEQDTGTAHAVSSFRSALAEFVSAGDIARHVESVVWPPLKTFYVTDTTHPAPHALQLLRNAQVRLTSSGLADAPRSLWLKHVPDAKPVAADVWLVLDLSFAQLKDLRAVKEKKEKKAYTEAQLVELVTWFNAAQAPFGVHDVMYRGVEDVARRLVALVT